MAQVLLYCLMLLFVLIGIVAVIYYIMVRILHPREGECYSVVIPVYNGNDEDAGMIYAAHMRLCLIGDAKRSRVIAVDMGVNDDSRRLLEDMCKEIERTELCLPNELAKKLMEK